MGNDPGSAPIDGALTFEELQLARPAQPLEQPWNYQDMGNNLIQRIAVTVR